MEQIIFTKNYAEPPVNRREILRYMRCREGDKDVEALLDLCLEELLPQLSYKVCWRIFPVHKTGEWGLDLGFMHTESYGLFQNLHGCEKFVLFAATIGLSPDRLIAKYGRVSPAKALFMQAIGAERIESLCDVFCGELSQKYGAEGFSTMPRFSPGYGDFPLESQKYVFQALDCHRKIGLSLNGSLLMTPSKSVTAIVGLSRKKLNVEESNLQNAQGSQNLQNTLDMPNEGVETRRNCALCGKRDCEFRQI